MDTRPGIGYVDSPRLQRRILSLGRPTMADQDQTPTPIDPATGDLAVTDLSPRVELEPLEQIEGEAVKGGGINRVVLTDGKIEAK